MNKFLSYPAKAILIALTAFTVNGCSDDDADGNGPVKERRR
jgi:hypothetical protein